MHCELDQVGSAASRLIFVGHRGRRQLAVAALRHRTGRRMAKKRNQQTFAKHARELAVKERRDRKRARKAEAAAQKAADAQAARQPGGPDAGDDAD